VARLYMAAFEIGLRVEAETVALLLLLALRRFGDERAAANLIFTLASRVLEREIESEARRIGIDVDEDELTDFLRTANEHRLRKEGRATPVHLGRPLLDLWTRRRWGDGDAGPEGRADSV